MFSSLKFEHSISLKHLRNNCQDDVLCFKYDYIKLHLVDFKRVISFNSL
jgi:hypothetical protein